MNSFLNKQSYLNKFQKGCNFIKRTKDTNIKNQLLQNDPCEFPTHTLKFKIIFNS